MSSRIPKDQALTAIDRLLSFWENRLGPDFKVGDVGLTEGKAMRATLANNLLEEQTAEDILGGKQTATNETIGNWESLWVGLRREVAVIHGTESPLYSAVPDMSGISASGGAGTGGQKTTTVKPSE